MGPDASIQKLPSNVRSLDLTDKNLTFIPIQFSKKSKLTTFILSKNNIHELPKNLKKLKTLVMSYNNIKKISSDMLEGLLSYPCIESLDFSYNLIQFFPSQILNIKTLKTLTLFGNQITSLNCSSESQLLFLDLGRNKLATPPTIPETLQTLILDCNELQDMSRLSNPAKVTRLCISRNKLESFNPSSSLPVLTTLDISNNKLTSLPNFLKVAPHLRQLDASDNFISELPLFPRTLSEIIMRNNRIRELPSSFSSLPCLIFADFSQNLIEELPVLPRVLQTLIIYDNHIETTQQTMVAEMFRLYMMNNQLEEVPFFKSNALAEYYLSSNNIKQIKVKNLSRVTNRLDVSNNKVEELPGELFVVPKSQNGMRVTHIFAHHNMIKSLPDEFVTSEAIALNLSMNPIDNLPAVLPETMEQFYVQRCSLSSLPLPDEEKDDVVELMASYNKISSIPHFRSLIMLNLSHNCIKELPKLPETIRFLDLSGNMIKSLEFLVEKTAKTAKKGDDADDDGSDDDGEKSDTKLALPLLESFDISFNEVGRWPDGLAAANLKTLKLRGNGEFEGEFAKMSPLLPSLDYLDATETKLEFTDESLSSIGHVILSEDARVLHVKRQRPTNEEEEEGKAERDGTESGAEKETEASDRKAEADTGDKKSDNEGDSNDDEEEDNSRNGGGDENGSKEAAEERTTNANKKAESEGESDSNQNKSDDPPAIAAPPPPATPKESEEAGSEGVDEEGFLTRHPPNIFTIPRTARISYSTLRHEREVNEDIVMAYYGSEDDRKSDSKSEEEEEDKNESESATEASRSEKEQQKVTLAAIFDSRSSGKVAKSGSAALKKLINSSPLSFSQKYFENVCNCLAEVINDRTVFDGSSIAISMIRNKEVFYTTVGDMRIIISNGKKDGFRIVQENIESGRKCGNKTLGQLSISKIVGDYLVYGVDISPKVNSLVLHDDDRFVIMICALVYEMLSMEQFDEILSEHNNAADLADAIKQATIGCMSSDNISVMVIDVSS